MPDLDFCKGRGANCENEKLEKCIEFLLKKVLPGYMPRVAPVHSPGPGLRRSEGGRHPVVYIPPQLRVGTINGLMVPFSGMASGIGLRATVFYPYSPSDTRHPHSCRNKYPGTGAALNPCQAGGKVLRGANPPSLPLGPRSQSERPVPGQGTTRLHDCGGYFCPRASSLHSGGCRTAHQLCSSVPFLLFLFFSMYCFLFFLSKACPTPIIINRR